MEDRKENEFQTIVKNVMNAYRDEMDNFIRTNSEGNLTDADVIIMNMNLIIGITTSMYYTIKEILSTTKIDYDYMRATIINHLKDNFDKIKEYKPKERFIPLTAKQVKEILDKGFVIVKMQDGTERKFTEKDIYINHNDEEKIKELFN